MVAAEYEAVQMYMQLAESIDDPLAVKVLVDVANEERVHAGEFQRLISILSPDEEAFLAEGAGEVNDMAAGREPEVTEAPQPAVGRRTIPTIGNLKT
jgi:rubrerythrin